MPGIFLALPVTNNLVCRYDAAVAASANVTYHCVVSATNEMGEGADSVDVSPEEMNSATVLIVW